MKFRSSALGLASVTAMLASFCVDPAKATAQSTIEFSATYNTEATIDPTFRPDVGVSRVTVTGESAGAPFGLTNFVSNTYGRFVPNTNVSIFDANPAVFGLEGLPVLGDRYFGGSNELFGTASDSATFDLVAGTVSGAGTITITDGTGIFENATGTIRFTQNDRLTSTDLSAPFRGQATLDFSVQTPQAVPEPSTSMGLVGIGAIGAGFLLRGSHKKGLGARG